MDKRLARGKILAMIIILCFLFWQSSGMAGVGRGSLFGYRDVLAESIVPVNLKEQTIDYIITAAGSFVFTGSTTSVAIIVNTAEAVTIILDNVTIDLPEGVDNSALDCNADVKLLLKNANYLKSCERSAIHVDAGDYLTINHAPNEAGSLNAISFGGSNNSAGIGSGEFASAGTVTISGGTITATGDGRPGIVGSVTITGG